MAEDDHTKIVPSATVRPPTAESLIRFALSPREFAGKIVSDSELETAGFTSAAGALYMMVTGAAIGAAISLFITIDTVPSLTPTQYAGYLAGLLVALVCLVVFGTLSCLTYRQSRRQIARIEKESAKRAATLFGTVNERATE